MFQKGAGTEVYKRRLRDRDSSVLEVTSCGVDLRVPVVFWCIVIIRTCAIVRRSSEYNW